MSKILSKEVQDLLGVSKNSANTFVEQLSKKYLIDLVPLEDIREINETAGTVGSPLTEEEIATLDEAIAAPSDDEDQSIAEADYPTDGQGEEKFSNINDQFVAPADIEEDDNYEGN